MGAETLPDELYLEIVTWIVFLDKKSEQFRHANGGVGAVQKTYVFWTHSCK
jgi:hypothetical protein